MTAEPVVVTTTWHTDDTDGEVELRYDPQAPFEVRATFRQQHPAEWVFARGLLLAGLVTRSGQCDVVVAPVGVDSVSLRLASPHGTGTFHLPAPAVRRFLGLSLAAVPLGDETVDLDDWTLVGVLAGWTS